MVYLDYPGSNEDVLCQQIVAHLRTPGYCIIRQFPDSEDNQVLIDLSERLGDPLHEPHNIDGKSVCLVEVDRQSELPAYANTPFTFPAHTDCADFPEPPDTVMLYCSRQTGEGGESFIVALSDLLTKLTPEMREALEKPQFHFRYFRYPILDHVHGQTRIRYSRLMIELHRRLNDLPEDEIFELLNHFDGLLETLHQVFKLSPGDCLIMDNQTLLHGRGQFPAESDRLLKRVRFNLHSHWQQDTEKSFLKND